MPEPTEGPPSAGGSPPTSPSGPTPPTGQPPHPTGPHRAPPALRRLRVSPSAVSAARERRRAGQRVIGATISYADTQVARTTFTVLLPEPGIAAKGKCVKPTTRNSGKHARRCTRYVVLGKFTHADRAGLNQFQFTGVARRTLAPHRYRLNAMPSAHGETGKTVSTTFTIVR